MKSEISTDGTMDRQRFRYRASVVADCSPQFGYLNSVLRMLFIILWIKEDLEISEFHANVSSILTFRYSLTPPLTGESTAPLIALPNCFTLLIRFIAHHSEKRDTHSTSPFDRLLKVLVALSISIRALPSGLICS